MKPCGDLGFKWATSKGVPYSGLGLHFIVVPSLGLRWTKSMRGLGLRGGCMVDLAHVRMNRVLGFVPVL
jgi:hypothetical protein